jgi:hypothetical protein
MSSSLAIWLVFFALLIDTKNTNIYGYLAFYLNDQKSQNQHFHQYLAILAITKNGQIFPVLNFLSN